jgi:acetylornithine aminotransferase
VVVTEPGYPVPARGAAFAGARVETLPLLESNGFLPDLDDVEDWDRVALFWVNYPNNPTGATAPTSFYERLAEQAREHDFVLCSDEAYSELWFDQPPRSALEIGDRSNVAVFQTLSKRSSMTGYRSGFVVGPTDIVGALKTYRPSTGAAPQEFVQRASVVAWGDEAHVERARDAYRRKRDVILPVLERKGWRVAASSATMYLWVEVADGETSEACAERLLRRGVVVAPGSYLGDSGEGYIRIALVPTLAECERAAAILEEVL